MSHDQEQTFDSQSIITRLTVTRKMNGITFNVAVCQSPAAVESLEQKLKNIMLQTAENERRKLSER